MIFMPNKFDYRICVAKKYKLIERFVNKSSKKFILIFKF